MSNNYLYNPSVEKSQGLAEEMSSHGLASNEIIPDGRIHRFHVSGDRPGSKNGWYVLYADGEIPAGAFGSWKTGESYKWVAKRTQPLSKDQRFEIKRKIEAAKKARGQELIQIQKMAAEKAAKIWQNSSPATDHPYLHFKGINPHKTRVYKDVLVLPIYHLKKGLVNLQFISPDGQKRFLSGGQIKGCLSPIGKIKGTKVMLVCEGFATGASLHEATGYPVACALNCNNLALVCKMLKEKLPTVQLVICADDDYRTKGNPGRTKATEILDIIDAIICVPRFKDQANRGTDFNDLAQIEGLESVRIQIQTVLAPKKIESENEPDPWAFVKRQYPWGPFPWEVLPYALAKSLQQLAKACATSPNCLPGAAIAIFASTIGSTVDVSPKKSWREPLIFWGADIRTPGAGKSPPLRLLMHVLYEAQGKANESYQLQLKDWEMQPSRDRGDPPPPPRGYYATDLTLEGLRMDHSGHGGKICLLDELSSFFSGQNQYKKKGSDRETWLMLFDGAPARIVRAKGSVTLTGARISLYGGIQPEIWKKCFSYENGLYLVDGTIYRFLVTFLGDSYYQLGKEDWADEHRQVWESLLQSSLSWADQHVRDCRHLILTPEAQAYFFDWVNKIKQEKNLFPPLIQAYVSKLVGYVLRFAGVFYLIERFLNNEEIGYIIDIEEIKKGIKAVKFYFGHAIYAINSIVGRTLPPIEKTDQITHLAEILFSLEKEVNPQKRLAIGYIQEKFNENYSNPINTPQLMGVFLRRCGLKTVKKLDNANGYKRVKTLQWDEKVDKFLDNYLEKDFGGGCSDVND